MDKVKCTGGTVCRDRNVRTYMRIRDTVHDRWEPTRNERGFNNFKITPGVDWNYTGGRPQYIVYWLKITGVNEHK